MKTKGKDTKRTSKKTAKSPAKEKPVSVLSEAMPSTTPNEDDTLRLVSWKPENSALAAMCENHIVPFGPQQTYIARDFLHTNNILNESMTVLAEQNDSLLKKVEASKTAEEREQRLHDAAHNVRQNAHALAAIVQAKVKYIKEVK